MPAANLAPDPRTAPLLPSPLQAFNTELQELGHRLSGVNLKLEDGRSALEEYGLFCQDAAANTAWGAGIWGAWLPQALCTELQTRDPVQALLGGMCVLARVGLS